MHIRLATPDDLPLVIEIIGEAAAWLEAKGVRQWPSPPNEHWRRRVAGQIARGECYLAYRGDEASGTLRLTWTDPYWRNAPQAAGYVHSLAIRTHLHGQQLGEALLNWAVEQIRQRGRKWVRLDCLASNSRLRRYYEALGFVYRGQVGDHDYVAALYEREL